MIHLTLKDFIEHFLPDLKDPAFTLMVMVKTIHIMKEEHKTTIDISIEMM